MGNFFGSSTKQVDWKTRKWKFSNVTDSKDLVAKPDIPMARCAVCGDPLYHPHEEGQLDLCKVCGIAVLGGENK